MTPATFLARLRELVAADHEREALDLTSQHLQRLAPSMTPEQVVEVGDLMEWADVALDLEESACASEQTASESQSSRSA
jgi:hypothetical protein